MPMFPSARAKHVAPRPPRRGVRAGLALAVGAAASLPLVLTSGVGTAVAADACDAPVVRDVVVNQGLPGYATLARGKTALVKAYLTEPSPSVCPTLGGKTFRVTGGSVSVTTPAGTATVSDLVSPTAGAKATVAEYGTPQADSPGDPVIVVPGRLLDSAEPAPFTASFRARIDYVVVDGLTGAESPGGSLDVSTRPDGSPFAAQVGTRTKPVRVLVVPMGDTSSSTPQFPADAQTSLNNAMTALSRILPVADGASAIGASGGVQYKLSAGMINLGQHIEMVNGLPTLRNYMGSGSYCGSASHATYISQKLGENLQAWNSENPTLQADRVLGVVWQGVSQGPTTHPGSGCVEGYAGIAGQYAWTRVTTPSVSAPGGSRQGTTGAVAAQELVHTYGGSLQSPAYHSSNTQADNALGDTDRAYNTITRRQLANDRSALRFDLSPWDDYTTLLERPDWHLTSCVLRAEPGTQATSCGVTATNGGSAAAGSIVLTGSTDGTVAGTDAHTYFESDQLQDGTDPASTYRLVTKDPQGVRLTPADGVGVRMEEQFTEHHGVDVGEHAHEATALTFTVALDGMQQEPLLRVPGRTARFELWKGTPDTSGGVLLYARELDDAPTFLSSSDRALFGSVVNWSQDGRSAEPALSPDGSLVARVRDGQVQVAPTTDAAQLSNGVPASAVAWDPSTSRIAVVDAGSLRLHSVTRTVSGVTIGAATTVYDAGLAGGLGGGAASDPAFAPSGDRLAFALSGDLWSLDLTSPLLPLSAASCSLSAQVSAAGVAADVPPCARLTASPATESSPAFSVDGATLAFQRGDGTAAEVWTLQVAAPASTEVKRLDGAASPAYGGRDLLVVEAGGVGAYDAATFAGRRAITTTPGDSAPAISFGGSAVAVQRGTDVYLNATNKRRIDVVVSDATPGQTRLDVVVRCGSTSDPVVTGGRPQVRPDGTAAFSETYDASRLCPVGTTVYRVTDGFHVARRVEAGPTPGSGSPSVAVYSPTAGQRVLEHQELAVAGSATSVTGEPVDGIAWTLAGPAGSGFSPARSLGTGNVLPDLAPPATGWAPGSYTLTATYDDPDAGVVSTARQFVIEADGDGDGIEDVRDVRSVNPCFPTDAPTNAAHAQTDPDGDHLPSVIDPAPCVSDVNMDVRFTSRTVDQDSQGNFVKMRIASSALDLRKVTADSTGISAIGGFPVHIPASFVKVFSANEVVVGFDRQAYIAAVTHFGWVGSTVPVAVRIAPPLSGYGFDPAAPTNQL